MNVLLSLLIVAIDPDAPIELPSPPAFDAASHGPTRLTILGPSPDPQTDPRGRGQANEPAATPATDERYPGATEVFCCSFDEAWDKNFDRWPDQWSRRHDREHPHFVSVRISDEATPAGTGCLRIDLDGGAAAAFSPTVPVSPHYTYVLEGLIQTEGLAHDEAYLSLNLLNAKHGQLKTLCSEKIRGSHGWKRLRIGPIAPTNDATSFAKIGVHLEPNSRADLTGSARFDELWLGRLPRIRLSANSPHHVFTDSQPIRVTCRGSGWLGEDLPVVFRLEDVFGTPIAEDRQHVTTRLAVQGSLPREAGASQRPPCLVGSAEWEPPIPGPGFYRVHATIQDHSDLVHRRQLTLAVIRDNLDPPGGEFGWTLPQGDQPLPLPALCGLLSRAGISRVKYPLWFDEKTGDQRIQELIRFSQRLTAHGIQLVGLLSDPPEAVRKQFPDCASPAEIFTADPQRWYPSLETAMTRMGTQVRWWQLGQDQELGFVGYPKLAEKIARIKGELDRLSHDVRVGFGWDWTHQLPQATGDPPAWRFLALSADPPLTHRELAAYLAATQQPAVRRWVVLEPLPKSRYSLSARATDLVWRMTSAKIHGAEGVFVPNPFKSDRGLMNDDGTPGELLLPWRTSALLLGGAEYSGSIQLPQGSENHLFARSSGTVMIVSSDTPKEEVIYLGPDVRQLDLWGRTIAVAKQEHRQVLEVGPLPTFVVGIDQRVVGWRQSFRLANDRLRGAGGQRQNRLLLKSSFEEAIHGRIDLVVPDSWEVSPRRTEFRLVRDEPLEQELLFTLPPHAASGRYPIRADFEIDAQAAHRFSVYRHIEVGSGDVYIELVTLLNDRGELVVEQHLVNETPQPVSFQCRLDAPGRRRQTARIIGPGRGREVNTYRLPDGRQLIGKTLWLQAEQIGGPQVLNYRFVARD